MSAQGDGASLLGSDEPGTGCSCRSRRCWVIRIVSTALAVVAAVAVGILLPRYLHEGDGKAAPQSSAYETSCSLWCSSPLLSAVELQAVFSDSKTFVDMPLWYNTSVEATLDAFKEWKGSLADFVHGNFQPAGTGLEKAHLGDWQPSPPALALQNATLRGWAHALHALWSDQFARQVSNDTLAHPSLGTLLPLPHTIVVPGGRFREVYYWDSYWILLGLLRGGLLDTSRALLANMAWQLQQFGFIPNGARTYYAASSAARSQPPMFSEMVVAVAQATNDKGILAAYAPAMGAELENWLKEHTVKVGRHTLFRYTTTATQPRPESFREDAQHAQAAGFSSLAAAGSAGLFAEIAGAAETGWDFSSRWLHPAPEPGTFNFTNMHTSCVLPADLNSILYRYLLNVVYALDMLGNDAPALPRSRDAYADLAAQLATSIRQVLWQPGVGVWADAVNPAHEAAVPTCPAEVPDATALQLRRGTAAAFVGMWAGCGRRAPRGPSTAAVPCVWNTGNASEVGLTTATLVGGPLWQANGVMTSAVYTGQQWDAPCGWAPLQWWLHEGLLAGGQPQHARELARRWLATNLRGWQADGVMYEKYNVTGPPGHRCSGGEYTPQSGFGWTNGVALDFMVRYNFTSLAA